MGNRFLSFTILHLSLALPVCADGSHCCSITLSWGMFQPARPRGRVAPRQPSSSPASQHVRADGSHHGKQPAKQPSSQAASQATNQPSNQPASQPASQPARPSARTGRTKASLALGHSKESLLYCCGTTARKWLQCCRWWLRVAPGRLRSV